MSEETLLKILYYIGVGTWILALEYFASSIWSEDLLKKLYYETTGMGLLNLSMIIYLIREITIIKSKVMNDG